MSFFIESKINASGNTFIEPAIWIYNHAAWPARTSKNLSARYFVDLSEGFAAGLQLDDYTISGRGAGDISELLPWDVEHHIYYVEISFQNENIYPGGISESRREAQVRIAASNNAWNSSNDWSFKAGNNLSLNTHIPIYDQGKLIFGIEPQGGNEIPIASFTVDNNNGYAPLLVDFDASASSEPSGQSLTYQWDFGDGNTATGQKVSHTFTAPQSYQVTLTVSNPDGVSAQSSQNIQVLDNTPIASFTSSVTSGVAPLLISFDASESKSPTGSLSGFSWDFGDGTQGNGVSIEHEYATPGNYTVTLTVKDNTEKNSKYYQKHQR